MLVGRIHYIEAREKRMRLSKNRLKEEAEAFLNAIYEQIDENEQSIIGDVNKRNYTLHNTIIPIYIFNNYKKVVFKSPYYDIILSNIIEAEGLLVLGFYNSAMNLLRSSLESVFKLFYYELHPVELILHKENNHLLTITDYREFIYIHPQVKKLDSINKESVEVLWKNLCAFVHNDIKVLKNISVLTDIKSMAKFKEKDFQNLISNLKSIVKVVLTLFLVLDNSWTQGMDNSCYKFIVNIFEPNEFKTLKEVVGIG